MDHTLAGRGRRLAAALIDLVPVVVLQVIRVYVQRQGVSNTPVMNVVVILLVVLLVYVVYQLVILTNDGQTIGKKILHIRIIDVHTGQNGGFVTNVLKRSFLNTLLSIVPFYAFVDPLFIFRDDRRCIHDFIAGTRVVEAS